MLNIFVVILGKIVVIISRIFNLGHGSTWPGHVALLINKNFIKELVKANPHLKIVLIAGTNGKTTTGKLLRTILEKANYRVFQNESGANLLNGIASSLLLHSSILLTIHYDYAIFEVDEATFPLVLKGITPDYIILLNLFRDQLDRYGEVNAIVSKWGDAIRHLLPKTRLILNADDPQIANMGKDFILSSRRIRQLTETERSYGIPKRVRDDRKCLYFGLNDKKLAIKTYQHAVDSIYCPKCGSKLFYNTTYYSHLGDWECKNCDNKRPKNIFSNPPRSQLSGIYNKYNLLAAALVAKNIGVSNKTINDSLRAFTPAFGRQEILKINDKKIQIFLSKNPTSFNESLRTVASLGPKHLLLVLNDRIPDGRDVSWIWDVDFEDYVDQFKSIIISGDRCYDIVLRLKYAVQSSKFKVQSYSAKCKVYEDLKKAIAEGTRLISNGETLYVLPTYSAMLEVRKILTGKKIL